jgi:hypothetical protein
MNSRLQKLGGGWASWRWLQGVSSKEKSWLLGVVQDRSGYIAWSMFLAKGLGEEAFLLEFKRQADPWLRAKLVGQKISALRQAFRRLTEAERAELARTGETELKTGLELLGRDKKMIQDLIQIVDPPPAQ